MSAQDITMRAASKRHWLRRREFMREQAKEQLVFQAQVAEYIAKQQPPQEPRHVH